MLERILSLDISTKTGYAVLLSSSDSYELESYGQILKISMPTDEEYPGSYVTWAELVFYKILDLIIEHRPDCLVIEETTKSQNSMSQKILEFIHFLVAKHIKESKIKAVYMMTGVWRGLANSKMTKEERVKNKEISAYKKKHGTKLAKNAEGKVIGKIGKKHVSVRRVNELFGLNLKVKDNDISDAILLSIAYHIKKTSSKIKDTI